MTPPRTRDDRPVIDLTVGELAITGIDVAEPRALTGAVEHRLVELLTERGLPVGVTGGGGLDRRSADLVLPEAVSVEDLGRCVADAVWTGLGGDPA